MNTFKNPIFWAVVLFLGGWIVGAAGWIKNESTVASATHGAVLLIVIGVAMIIAGGIMFFTVGNRK
jgi:hypothetical protein